MTQDDRWRDATTTIILRFRITAIRHGASPLTVWDYLSERLRLAARRASSVQTWCTDVLRSLRVGATDAETSTAMVDLAALVGADSDARRWLTWLEDEHQFLMAFARARFDAEKAERQSTNTEKTKRKRATKDAP